VAIHYTTSVLASAFDVDPNTLRNWLQLSESVCPLGTIGEGRRRLFNEHDAYVIGCFAGLFHAGVPVGPDAIGTVLSATFDDDGNPLPAVGMLMVRESESVEVALYLDKAASLVREKLGVV
jgi:hypothetical protein